MAVPSASDIQSMSDPLMQRFFLTPEEKASKEKGKSIVKAFYNAQINNNSSLNYFAKRNSRWVELLLWCKGSQKMAEFLSFVNVSDANKSFLNIDMEQTRIAAQFVGTLIESMAKTETYPCVEAIDDGSLTEKERRFQDALFRMHDLEVIKQVQQQAGIHIEPPNAYVPDDELSARVHFELEDKLPKEIRFEKMLSKLQNDINFKRVVNRRTLFDEIVLNFAATKIERVSANNYTIRKCIPTNMVYNFFMDDTGELQLSQIGEFTSIKVRDFRAKFGKTPSRPEGMDEKQIFDMAKLSSQKNIGTFNWMWDINWAATPYNYNRPYDDYSILVLDCEIDCGEDVYYVEKTDSFGRKSISQKKGIPYQQKTKDGKIIEQPKPDDVNIIKSKKQSWMRGIYAPYGDNMLYWGPPDLIINEYTNVAKPLSSYSVNIPNNDGEYVPSLFERIMEPLREYQITKLTRKKLITQVRASGIRIDVESARNVDLGNGDSIEWEEVLRIYLNTGVELYSSKGVDPLQREAPALSNSIHDESIEKIIGLTNILAGIVSEIRQLIGVPPYRDGAQVGDRTANQLAESQMTSSYNVTDFILNANNQLWEETFYKICLLHWNDIVRTEPESKADMINTRFDVSVKIKSSEYQKQLLEQDIQRFSQMPDAKGNPLLSPKDALMLRELDNYKLQCMYLSSTVEANRQKALQDSQALQQQNQELQQQSAAQAQEQAIALQNEKLGAEKEMERFKAQNAEKLAIVNGLFGIAMKSPTGEIPDYLKPVAAVVIPNIVMPVAAENQQMQQGLHMIAQAQQAQQQQAQHPEMQNEAAPDQQPQGQPPPDQSQIPQQAA